MARCQDGRDIGQEWAGEPGIEPSRPTTGPLPDGERRFSRSSELCRYRPSSVSQSTTIRATGWMLTVRSISCPLLTNRCGMSAGATTI
jgi:hypothetical protein